MHSCSSSVLVEEAAEQVASMDAAASILAYEDQRGGRGRWLQSKRPMWPVPVVVVDIYAEHSREV